MIGPTRFLLMSCTAAVCLARLDPEWKMGTVVASPALRPTSALEMPVYAPSGVPVADVPGVQLMAIQSSQLAIIGEKTAYIIDKPGQTAKPAKRALPFRSPHGCLLTPNHQVMYHDDQKTILVLDDEGEVCKLSIVGREALHPEK